MNAKSKWNSYAAAFLARGWLYGTHGHKRMKATSSPLIHHQAVFPHQDKKCDALFHYYYYYYYGPFIATPSKEIGRSVSLSNERHALEQHSLNTTIHPDDFLTAGMFVCWLACLFAWTGGMNKIIMGWDASVPTTSFACLYHSSNLFVNNKCRIIILQNDIIKDVLFVHVLGSRHIPGWPTNPSRTDGLTTTTSHTAPPNPPSGRI